MENGGETKQWSFLAKLVATVLVLGLAWLAWQLRFVLLLVFASVLFAVVFRLAAGSIERRTGLSSKIATPLVVIVILATPLLAAWKFGADIASQADLIREAIPRAINELQLLLADLGIRQTAEQSLDEFTSGSEIYNLASTALMSVGDVILNVVIVVAGALFLAANPGLYREGALKLLPPASRGKVATALSEAGSALALWLKGRLVAMLLVSLVTGLGLWLIGIPSYIALGLLAGLLEFIPFVGPIIAAIPAVLLGLLAGPEQALLVAALYLVVQQLEGNLMTPIIQQHAVDLPAALLIFAVLAFGLLFGAVGVILAAPLTVVLFVLVKRLWVREYLGTPTPIPGSNEEDG